MLKQLDQRLVSSEETEVVDLKFSQASDLLPALQSVNERKASDEALQGRGHIEAVESANALILAGPAPWRSETRAVIERLDQPRQQVLVESVIMEVSDSLISELGVEWNTDVQGDGVEALTRFGIQNAEIPPVIQEWGGAGLALGWFRNGSLRAVVRAAANDTGTRILSTPRLATLDHAPAEILVGSNIPVKTGEALLDGNGQGQPFTTIERKDIGIALKVTPHINADGDVTLDIEQSVESVTPSSSTSTDIVTNKRQLKTRVRVQNETVLVLGGLSSQENNEIVDKVPLLGDIPVLGALFRNTRNETVNRHLMVFIQPKLITDAATAEAETSKAIQLVRDARAEAGLQTEAIQDEAIQKEENQNESIQNGALQSSGSQEDKWQTMTPTRPKANPEPPKVATELEEESAPDVATKTVPEASPEASRDDAIASTASIAAQAEKPAASEEIQAKADEPFDTAPEPVYAEETIELDEAVAHQTRSQGIRGAFVALPEAVAPARPQPSMSKTGQPARDIQAPTIRQQAQSKQPASNDNARTMVATGSRDEQLAELDASGKESLAPVVTETTETARQRPVKPATVEAAVERPQSPSTGNQRPARSPQSDYQWP